MRNGMRRILFATCLVVGAAGCSFFETPCGRVAGSICTIPGEDGSCQFLRSVKSENEMAQKTCTDLEPAAKAYAADPTSLLEKAKWAAASIALRAVGFVGDHGTPPPTPTDKLKNAANEAGDAASKAGDAISDMAKNAGSIVRDTAKEIQDSKK